MALTSIDSSSLPTANEVYSYELYVPYNDYFFYDNRSVIYLFFKDTARITEYLNGAEQRQIIGHDNIIAFLKEKNAVVQDLEVSDIGQINIKDYPSYFKKDGQININYRFTQRQFVNGRVLFEKITLTQVAYVSFYNINITNNFSSADNPLLLFKNDYTINDTYFNINIEYHKNTYNSQSISNVPSSDYTTSFEKALFNKDDADLTASPYRNKLTISLNSNYTERTLEHYFNVYFAKTNEIQSIEITKEDTNKYFLNVDNVFKKPNAIFEITLTDLTTIGNLTLDEIANNYGFTYRLYKYENGVLIPLVVDESIIDSNCTIVIKFGNTIDILYNIVLLDPKIVADTIIFSFSSITYGATLRDYENRATISFSDENGETYTNVKFTFTNTLLKDLTITPQILEKYNFTKTTIKVLGEEHEVNLPTTYTNPTFIVFENAKDIQLINKISTINLGKIKAKYGVFKNVLTNNWEKTFEVKLTYSNTATINNYSLSNETLNEYLDGTKVIDGISVGTYEIAINTLDYFDNSVRTQKINANVYDISNIESWSFYKTKNNYQIGEKYLDEADNTTIRMLINGTMYTSLLRPLVLQGLFNTNPQINYEFTRYELNKVVEVQANFGLKEIKNYTINIEQSNISNDTKKLNIVAIKVDNLIIGKQNDEQEGEIFDTLQNVWALVDISSTQVVNGKRVFIEGYGDNLSYKDDYCYGYLINVNENKSANSKVVLFKNYKNPLNSYNNMIVKFPCYVKGSADKINKSTFGIMFGSNNYNNRLFVSGNSEYPQYDWHTNDVSGVFNEEIDNENINNLTYFSDISEQAYGSSDNKVIGYDIISDSKLLVIKDKSDKETTLYFRQPSYQQDDNGLLTEVFSVSKANNSVSGINPKAVVNFNGDTLFIDSDNTIQGLDLTGIVGDTQRYANSRSLLIDKELKKADLSNSILWTNQKYLYFTINDYGTFITHYKTKESGQYEWFLVDYDNPQVFIEINNDIYYGNDKGCLFKITKDKYQDIHKVFVGKAEGLFITQVIPSNEQIVLSNSIINKVNNGDTFKHYIDNNNYLNNIYKKVCSIGTDETFELVIDTTNNVAIMKETYTNDGQVLYVNEKDTYYLNMHCNEVGVVAINCENEYYKFGEKYTFKFVKENGFITNKVKMYRDGIECDLSKLTCADICLIIDNEVKLNVDTQSNNTIKLENTDIVAYGTQGEQVEITKGEILHKENVNAYYITAPLLSNIQYMKTLWQFSLTNDSGIQSELKLAIARNIMPKNPKDYISYSSDGFDYDEVDYNDIDYEKIYIPRIFIRNKVIPKLNFVCFAFINDNDTNCVLSSMAITYTIPFPQV